MNSAASLKEHSRKSTQATSHKIAMQGFADTERALRDLDREGLADMIRQVQIAYSEGKTNLYLAVPVIIDEQESMQMDTPEALRDLPVAPLTRIANSIGPQLATISYCPLCDELMSDCACPTPKIN